MPWSLSTNPQSLRWLEIGDQSIEIASFGGPKMLMITQISKTFA